MAPTNGPHQPGHRTITRLPKRRRSLARRAALAFVALSLLLALLAPLSLAFSPDASRGGPVYHFFLPLAESNPGARLGHGLPSRQDQPQTYTLRDGDNLADLALELGRDVSTMACVTPSAGSLLSDLKPGQVIAIPPADSLCYTVQPGETLASIAERFGVAIAAIVETPWNELDSAEAVLEAGQRLLIPGAERPEIGGERVIPEAPSPLPLAAEQPAEPGPEPATAESGDPAPTEDVAPIQEIWAYGDGNFIWPVKGIISQGYRNGHRAIDIAAAYGLPVVAAGNGVVTKAGWSDLGYGLRVVIDHQIDYVTLYAHLAAFTVEEGQVVEKGQVIGYVGSTGNSTGPHVHFELRDFGYLVDVRSLLP